MNNDQEYLMLRAEILQYLQHYQSIRVFMYTSCAAIFVFLFQRETREPLMFLLPLLVIIPAYLSAANYWLCVTVDSAYLVVFHEEQGSSFQWERNHDQFSVASNCVGRMFSYLVMNIQPLAYILATLVCFAIYGYFLYNKRPYISGIEIIIGICCIVFCLCIFGFIRVKDKSVYIKQWREIQLMSHIPPKRIPLTADVGHISRVSHD